MTEEMEYKGYNCNVVPHKANGWVRITIYKVGSTRKVYEFPATIEGANYQYRKVVDSFSKYAPLD